MPALRDIRDDITLLANHFLTHYCRELHKEPKRLTASALKRLTTYSWPGNIRELENEIRQIAVLSRRTDITEEELSDTVRYKGEKGKATNGALPTRSLKAAVEDIEKRWIMDAMHMCRHNQLRAAKMLGLSRQGLIKKMKRYKIIAS
jgi:DNA-binding NtrC family response regulator